MMEDGVDDCVVINSVERYGDHSILVDTFAGKRGENGEVYGPDSEGSLHHITEEEATTGHTRTFLYIPSRGSTALFFSEYCQRGTSGTRIMNCFKRYLRDRLREIKMDVEFVLEGSDWLDQIRSVKSIEIHACNLPDASHKALGVTEGSFNVEFQPKRGESFAKRVLGKLRKSSLDYIRPETLLGIPDNGLDDGVKVSATVEGPDGRRKKVDVDNERLPHFLRTLTQSGEAELDNTNFVHKCLWYAEEIMKRTD